MQNGGHGILGTRRRVLLRAYRQFRHPAADYRRTFAQVGYFWLPPMWSANYQARGWQGELLAFYFGITLSISGKVMPFSFEPDEKSSSVFTQFWFFQFGLHRHTSFGEMPPTSSTHRPDDVGGRSKPIQLKFQSAANTYSTRLYANGR